MPTVPLPLRMPVTIPFVLLTVVEIASSVPSALVFMSPMAVFAWSMTPVIFAMIAESSIGSLARRVAPLTASWS